MIISRLSNANRPPGNGRPEARVTHEVNFFTELFPAVSAQLMTYIWFEGLGDFFRFLLRLGLKIRVPVTREQPVCHWRSLRARKNEDIEL